MRIRRLREDDLGQIVKMIHSVYGSEDARQAMSDLKMTFEKNKAYKFQDFFVAEISGDIVAAGGVYALSHEPIAHLDWFVVNPKQQRKGIGSMLLRHCIEDVKKRKIKILTAETSSGKEYKAAAGFFLHNGFRVAAEIPRYWEDGKAWVFFFKRI